MRRQAIAFFLGDAAFLSDSKFRALARRLPDPDEFNSAVGAWWIALAAARRNGRPNLDIAAETGTRFIDDLRAVGLLTVQGFPADSWEAWDAMRNPAAAHGGKARAARADRDGRGRFSSDTSRTSALDALDVRYQRAPASPPLLSNVEYVEGGSGGEHGPDGWPDPEGEALTWLVRHGCFVRPGNGYHQKLVLAVERHGVNGIVGMFDRLAEAGVVDGDIKGFLFGAIDALDARTRPKTSDLERAERADEQRAVHERGVAATQDYLRRLRETGDTEASRMDDDSPG